MSRAEFGPRLGVFLIAAGIPWLLLPSLLAGLDLIAVSALTVAFAGVSGNLLAARIFEGGALRDFGLGWSRSAVGRLLLGFALGAGTVGALAAAAVALGLARFVAASPLRGPADGTTWTLSTLAPILLLGAMGEELLFRGYLFQYLARAWSATGVIAGSGVFFGLAHLLLNSNINPLGAWNTALWGALLGYACWRGITTGEALWMPTGIHFGWNLGLVAIGVPVSGITIEAAGLKLQWSASPWISGGEYGPEGGVLASILGAGLFLVLRGGLWKRGGER